MKCVSNDNKPATVKGAILFKQAVMMVRKNNNGRISMQEGFRPGIARPEE